MFFFARNRNGFNYSELKKAPAQVVWFDHISRTRESTSQAISNQFPLCFAECGTEDIKRLNK